MREEQAYIMSKSKSKSRTSTRKKKSAFVQKPYLSRPPAVAFGAITLPPIVEVNLSECIAHPAQPPRHAPEQVQDLLHVITETGVIDPIVIVPIGKLGVGTDPSKKYYIVNGNRRSTVAALLGLTTLRAQRLPEVHTHEALMRLWTLFNGGARRISSKDTFYSWGLMVDQHGPIAGRQYLSHVLTWSRATANQIETLVSYVGLNQAVRYALSMKGKKAKYSPNVVTRIRDFIKEAESQGKFTYVSSAFLKKLVAWFYRHDMYREIGDTKKLLPSWGGRCPELLDAITKAVEANTPFSLNAHISFDMARPVGQTRRAQVMSDGMVQTIPTGTR